MRDRVPRDDVGALGEQPAGQHEGGRLARVVGVRLEREAEERDALSAQGSETCLSLPITRRFWSSFTSITAFSTWKWYPEFAASCFRASESFGKQLPPKPTPARRKLLPIRRSWPMPSATLTTSAPVASHTFAISLMNEIRVISAAFAASLIISAEATSDRTTGASMPRWSPSTASPSASSNAPTTIRSGSMKSRTAVPSAVNSGLETYPTCASPRSSRRCRTFSPVPTGTVDFIATTTRWSTAGSSSITVQTAERSASPE